jgi:hypothetical protein
VSFPAIANWLEASASVSIPVSGDFATTANFALVVSGVPTSGENTNASGAEASRAPAPGVPSWCSSQAPRPEPPMYARRTSPGSGRAALVPVVASTTSACPK